MTIINRILFFVIFSNFIISCNEVRHISILYKNNSYFKYSIIKIGNRSILAISQNKHIYIYEEKKYSNRHLLKSLNLTPFNIYDIKLYKESKKKYWLCVTLEKKNNKDIYISHSKDLTNWLKFVKLTTFNGDDFSPFFFKDSKSNYRIIFSRKINNNIYLFQMHSDRSEKWTKPQKIKLYHDNIFSSLKIYNLLPYVTEVDGNFYIVFTKQVNNQVDIWQLVTKDFVNIVLEKNLTKDKAIDLYPIIDYNKKLRLFKLFWISDNKRGRNICEAVVKNDEINQKNFLTDTYDIKYNLTILNQFIIWQEGELIKKMSAIKLINSDNAFFYCHRLFIYLKTQFLDSIFFNKSNRFKDFSLSFPIIEWKVYNDKSITVFFKNRNNLKKILKEWRTINRITQKYIRLNNSFRTILYLCPQYSNIREILYSLSNDSKRYIYFLDALNFFNEVDSIEYGRYIIFLQKTKYQAGRIAHEYMHVLVRFNYGRSIAYKAAWLFEGIAEYFRYKFLLKNEKKKNYISSAYNNVLKNLYLNNLIDITKIQTQSNFLYFRHIHPLTLYENSFLFVSFLINNYGLRKINNYFMLLQTKSSSDAFKEIYNISLRNSMINYYKYLKKINCFFYGYPVFINYFVKKYGINKLKKLDYLVKKKRYSFRKAFKSVTYITFPDFVIKFKKYLINNNYSVTQYF